MVEVAIERGVKVQKSVESLNTQIETLRAQLDKLEIERNALMIEWDGFNKRVDELSADSLPVKEIRDSIRRILEDKDGDVSKLCLFVDYSENIRVNKKFIGGYQDKIERLEEKLEKLAKIEQLKEDLEEIHQLERKLAAKISENDDDTEETAEEIRAEINTLQAGIAALEKENKANEAAIAELFQ